MRAEVVTEFALAKNPLVEEGFCVVDEELSTGLLDQLRGWFFRCNTQTPKWWRGKVPQQIVVWGLGISNLNRAEDDFFG